MGKERQNRRIKREENRGTRTGGENNEREKREK